MKDIEEDDDYQDIYKPSPVPLEYVAALQFQKIYGNILGRGTVPRPSSAARNSRNMMFLLSMQGGIM